MLEAREEFDLSPANKLILMKHQELKFLESFKLVCFRQKVDVVVG
jgi:hypothetical protein